MRSTANLFDEASPRRIVEDAYLLRGFALHNQTEILQALARVTAQSPFRHMETPGGYAMSVAMSNCGQAGWVTDRKGYRYSPIDPQTDKPWPAMPEVFAVLAQQAAQQAGFQAFAPDACLINCYQPNARMGLHQDKDEQDAAAPIVSVSLGLPARFLFGGLARTDKAQRITLEHGDVVVWGGAARFNYHGIAPLKAGHHPLLGQQRINLTFRKAL